MQNGEELQHNSQVLETAESEKLTTITKRKPIWLWGAGVAFMVFAILGVVAYAFHNKKPIVASNQTAIKQQQVQTENLSPVASSLNVSSDKVVVNGQLQANQNLILAPSNQPTSAQAGEIYLDSKTNQIRFFNGKNFTSLLSSTDLSLLQTQLNLLNGQQQALASGVVTSLQGQTGDVTLSGGSGIGINGTSIANTGVLSLQGHTGNVILSAGSGISISGTSIGLNSTAARLNSSGNGQIFTGTSQIFRNSSNGALGFGVQTAAGQQVLTVDTATNTVVFGQAGVSDGQLSVASVAGGKISVVPTSTAGNFTITLPNATGTICLDSGNCSSSGANVELSNLSGVAINTALLPNSAGLIALGSTPLPFSQLYLSGTSGTPDTNNFLITGISTGGQRTITLPDASGTICLSTFNCLGGSGGGASDTLDNLQSVAINSSLLPGVAGAIDVGSAAKPFSSLYLSGTSSSPATNNFFITGASTGGTRTITLPDATGTVCLVSTCGGGADVGLDNLSGVAINASLLPDSAGSRDLGSSSLPFGQLSLAGTSSSPSLNNFLITGASTGGTRTITLPDATGTVCLVSTCGGGGGGADVGLDNLSGVAINASLLPGSAGGIDLGSGAKPFGHLYVAGDSSTPGTNNFLITGASTGGTRTITLPDASGTICLDTTACGGGGGSGSGANTSLSNLSSVAINTSLLPGAGVSNLIDIGSSSFLFRSGYYGTGITTPLIQSTGALNIAPGGSLTVGATSQTLTLQGGASSSFSASSGGNTIQVLFAVPSGGNKTITIPNLSGTLCLSTQNCLGGSGGGASDTLNNLQSVAINTTLLPGNAGTVNLGSAPLPFGQLYISGTSGSPATNNYLFTGAATAARTITIPDATGTICLSTGNCLGGGSGGANTSLSNLQNVAINIALLGATNNSIDIGSSGTNFRSGYFGTSLNTPLLQSVGTLNITPGGTLTVGSSGQTLTLQGGGSTSLNATVAGVTNQLSFATPTSTNKTITIPDETGTICTTFASAACVAAYTSGGVGGGNFVKLQASTPGTPDSGNLNVSGTGIFGTAAQSLLFDTPSGTTTLNIGTTNATSGINLNQSTVLAAGKTLKFQPASGGGSYTLQASNTSSNVTFNLPTALENGGTICTSAPASACISLTDGRYLRSDGGNNGNSQQNAAAALNTVGTYVYQFSNTSLTSGTNGLKVINNGNGDTLTLSTGSGYFIDSIVSNAQANKAFVVTSTGKIGTNLSGISALPSADLSFGVNNSGCTCRSIDVIDQTTVNTSGTSLNINAADGNGGANSGGAITLTAGSSGANGLNSVNEPGGAITLNGGNTSGAGGSINLQGGVASVSTGNIFLQNGGGNVGIACASPSAKLCVGSGGVNVTGNSTFNNKITIAAGGLTVSAGGLTVSAGGITSTGTFASTGTVNVNTSGSSTTNIGTGSSGAVTVGNTSGSVTNIQGGFGFGVGVTIKTGSNGSGSGAAIQISTGAGSSGHAGGDINLLPGNGTTFSDFGGSIKLQAGNAPISCGFGGCEGANGGLIKASGGDGIDGIGGDITITAGDGSTGTTSSGQSGNVNITGGDGTAGNIGGGNISIDAGAGLTNGNINVGTTNAASIAIGNSSAAVTIQGSSLVLTGALRLSSYGAGTLTTDASGNVTASSDIRLKDVQGSFNDGLDAIMQLDPILYKWNLQSGYDTTTTYAGFSAQNVQSVIPEAVGIDNRGYLTLNDRPILAATVNAIKTQQQEIQNLQSSPNQPQDANFTTLNVSGQSTLASLSVLGTTETADLIVSGATTLGTLTVNGSASFNGSLSVNGHIISGNNSGSTTVTAGTAACNAPTVTISGNDTSGTVTITTGGGCSAAGTMVTVNFANAFGSAPRVTLTPASQDASSLSYFNGNASSSSFSIDTSSAPTADTQYKFNYLVVQ